MSAERDRLVRALLHEGYLLYPYRPSALKNRWRWTIGALMPPGQQEPSRFAVDLLAVSDGCASRSGDETRTLRGLAPGAASAGSQSLAPRLVPAARPRVRVRVCGLHPFERADGWQEAVERELALPWLPLEGLERVEELLVPADAPGDVRQAALRLRVRLAARPLEAGAWRIELALENAAPPRPASTPRSEAVLAALVSSHALVALEGARFASLRDPPPGLEAAARAARCEGWWPVLLDPEEVLVSPMILDEPPALAPESQGDLFDGTEIDEMLALRARTLLPEEAREAAASDPRAKALLELTGALGPVEMGALHGRVRLRPRRRADVMDLALDGKTATVVAVERDVDGRAHLQVVLDDDPGRDLGLRGDTAGHRFFFGPDEVEPL